MLTAGELAQLRSDQESLLADTCTVSRASAAAPVFDEEQGTYTEPAPSNVYTGSCRISPLTVQDRAALFGERAVDLVMYQGTFPHDAPVFEKDDVVEVTASADSQLVGRRLEVHGFEVKTIQTARRVFLQEVR